MAPEGMAHDSQEEKTAPVVLTVQPHDAGGKMSREIRLTREDLMAFPQAEFETATIWTQGKQRFEGVWLSDLMAELDIREGTLALEAINDYWVEIPMSEVTQGGALLAHSRNGDPMQAREMGPVWVVYNYDSDPAFRTETIYSRSVWQLDRITISR
jgi:hypothetical protein